MRFGAKRQCPIVRCHDQVHLHHLFPEQRGCEVDGVQGAEFGGHRLSGPFENNRIDLDQLELTDQRQNRPAPARDLRIRQTRAQPKSIQGTETLGEHQGTRHTLLDLPPLVQRVGLSECHPEEHGGIHIGNQRCP